MEKLNNASMSGAHVSKNTKIHNKMNYTPSVMAYQRRDLEGLSPPSIFIYSCRAECQQDVLIFLNTLFIGSNRVLHAFIMPDGKYPDTMLEFGLAKQDNQTLLDILDRQPDSHVMLETLRQCPLSQNSGRRQYDPYPLLTAN